MTELEKEIKDLIDVLYKKRIARQTEVPFIENTEKLLSAKLGQLTNQNLTSITENLENIRRQVNILDVNVAKLDETMHAAIDAQRVLMREQQEQARRARGWMNVLIVVVAILIAFTGIHLRNLNTLLADAKTQRTAQGPGALWGQPALLIKVSRMGQAPSQRLSLINVGNSTALNITLTAYEGALQCTAFPDFLQPQKEAPVYLVAGSEDLSALSSEDIKRKATSFVTFADNEEMKIGIEYEDIHKVRYVTMVRVSRAGVTMLETGRGTKEK